MPPSSKNEQRLYKNLAWAWPIISPPEHYVEEAELFHELIAGYSRIDAKTLLHLGCGAGHIDHALKRHFDITGVDVRREMIAHAKRLNPEATYLQGDMRSVRLDRAFDAVLVADSITYMLSVKELRDAFATAYVHLKPGGSFCTYAELTRERLKQNFTECSVRSRGDVEIVFIENTYDPNPKDTTCEFTFVYLIRRKGRLTIETDRHLAGVFRKRTWLDLLRDVGFRVRQMTYPGEGIPVFVCLKPSKKTPTNS